MTDASATRHVLLGTAGHIDHGKTRLVAALTGVNTDRLPEEKARGISIDLGFASWSAGGVEFGIVDVPGHERFLRNMVAGATGVNIALLVVAADDGVMPQTREHLDVLQLLGVSSGVAAITKTDLVERELVELVIAEVRELSAGSFLAGCPIVPVSSVTGEGLETLKKELIEAARRVTSPPEDSLFRMPIDRVFSLPGRGTVVTGSVLSGSVRPDDRLELLPGGVGVRVRSVQSHHRSVDQSGAWRRTAINLASLSKESVSRGDELATPGYLRPSGRLIVSLRHLASSPVRLKDRMELSLHLGTSETLCRVIHKRSSLAAGEEVFAELRTRRPVIAAYGQHFILRRSSPALTIAGGVVIDPGFPAGKRLQNLVEFAARAAADDPLERYAHLFSRAGLQRPTPLEAAWRAGIRPEEFPALLRALQERGEVVLLRTTHEDLLVHRACVGQLKEELLRRLRGELERQAPRRSLPRAQVVALGTRRLPHAAAAAVVEQLLSEGVLVADEQDNLGPVDMQVRLSRNQARTRSRILAVLSAAGLTPPAVKSLAAELGQSVEQLQPLLRLCVEESSLVQLTDEYFVTPGALDEARRVCDDYLRRHTVATVSQLREAWGVSRRYAFPMCEWFDARGITLREGEVRRAGPRIGISLVGPDSSARESQ